MDFTYDSYFDLMGKIKKNGFSFSFFESLKDNNSIDYCGCKKCILRHDVDFSVEKAYELAELEYDRGISSTYFFLITSDEYNIFSRKNSDMVNKIRERGHRIGLHFDETRYEKWITKDDFVRNVIREIDIFKTILGIEIKVVSMHEPSERVIESDLKLENDEKELVNTYSSFYIKNYRYVSDSCMIWHEDIETIVNSSNYDSVQILTHPIWWNKEKISRKTILNNYCEIAGEKRKQRLFQYYPEDLSN